VKRRSNLLFFVFASMLLPSSLSAQKNSCVECHTEMEGALKAPVEAFNSDVHRQFGLSCHGCHGGNPAQEDVELAKDRTFKGAPQRTEIPALCGGCHADSVYMRKFNPNLRVDQLSLYWTSRHGEMLKQGDPNVAVCTDCHGVHGIQAANFPKSQTFPWNIPQTCGRCHAAAEYMKSYSLPVDQTAEYKQSVHAAALFEKKDLSAPVCNDCHGNHGAVPPEVTSIAYVCRQCHPSAGDLFNRSPHRAAFDGLEISECEACHGNHKIVSPTDEMLAGGRSDVCVQCHDAGSTDHQAGQAIKTRLDDYLAAFQAVQGLLHAAEKKGVEIGEAEFRLQEASTALIQVRNLTHSLDVPEIEKTLSEGTRVMAEVKGRGEAALREARFRKTGLVVATVFILLLALALYFKIRDLHSGKPA
jgi:predicted CXXCH cytochrome family protein